MNVKLKAKPEECLVVNKETPAEESTEFKNPVKGEFVTVYLETHGNKQLFTAQILEMDD